MSPGLPSLSTCQEFLPESLWTNQEAKSDVSAPGARALCQPGWFASLYQYDRGKANAQCVSQLGRGWQVPEEWGHMAVPHIGFPHQCHTAGLFLPEKGQNQLWKPLMMHLCVCNLAINITPWHFIFTTWPRSLVRPPAMAPLTFSLCSYGHSDILR